MRVDLRTVQIVVGSYFATLLGKNFEPEDVDNDVFWGDITERGWNRLYEVSEAQMSEHEATVMMTCECREKKQKWARRRVTIDGVKTTKNMLVDFWQHAPGCLICHGSGKRVMTRWEHQQVVEWARMRRTREHGEARGEDCCVMYVVESTDFNSKNGAWHPPETDQITKGGPRHNIDGFSWGIRGESLAQKDVIRETVTVPIKRYSRGGVLIETVEQTVQVARLESYDDYQKRKTQWIEATHKNMVRTSGYLRVKDL